MVGWFEVSRWTETEGEKNRGGKRTENRIGLPQLGGVTSGGLGGVRPRFLEIGRFRPFFRLLRPFPEGAKRTWEI